MRVLIRRQARRRACVLAWMFAAVGALTTAAADVTTAVRTIALEPGEPMSLGVEADTQIEFAVRTGPGQYLLAIQEQFAIAAVRVARPGRPDSQLRSIGAEVHPIYWLTDGETESEAVVSVRVERTSSRAARLTFELQPLTDAAEAYRAESALSLLANRRDTVGRRAARQVAESLSDLWADAGDEQASSRALLAAASLSRRLGDFERSLALAQRSATTAPPETPAQGYAQSLQGLILIELGRYEEASVLLGTARGQLAPVYDDRAINPAASNLCFLALNARELENAESCYRGLIEAAEAYGDPHAALRHLGNLGGAFAERGDASRAAAYYRDVLANPLAARDTRTRARALSNLGLQLVRLGQFEEALAAYREALGIARALDNANAEASYLGNIAIAYGKLGAPQQALSSLEQVHDLLGEQRSPRSVQVKRNYAGALMETGELASAERILEQAVDLATEIDDTRGLSMAQQLLAVAKRRKGDSDDAILAASAAVTAARRTPEDRRLLATALVAHGRTLIEGNDVEAAIPTLENGLALWREIGDPQGTVSALAPLGWARWHAGENAAAKAIADIAMRRVEDLRSQITNPDLRSAYIDGVADVFELALMCRMADGDANGALEVAERYRAKTLVDVLSRSITPEAVMVPAALTERRDRVLAAIRKAEDDRLRGGEQAPIAPLISELDAIDAEIAKTDPRLAAVTGNDAITALAMRSQHGDGEATIQYYLGRDQSVAWMITSEGIASARLPGRARIDAEARRLHDRIERRSDISAEARTLGNWLLAPFADALADYATVAIVADGTLQYVPFDVLTTDKLGDAPLRNVRLSSLPSLTTLSLARRLPPAGGSSIAVIADPVFAADDSRLSGLRSAPAQGAFDRPQLNRLRLSLEEAKAIEASARERKVRTFTGLAATPAILNTPEIRGASILHIATHGFADDEVPARTGFAMSMYDASGQPATGFVGLRDIYTMRLDAELVVLSACETALGQDLAGEGLLGLTRGFMYAGARRVVSTLWRVEDRATSVFMAAFYGELLAGASPADALLAAKQALRGSRRYNHPYFWSGFTLQGDWRS